MSGEVLTASRRDELFARQERLQTEARAVCAELDLVSILARAGIVEQVGSSITGLMVWRDLDFNILGASRADVAPALAEVLSHAGVFQCEFHDQTGPRTPPELRGDERDYAVLRYRAASGAEWKIDLSFWRSTAPRDQVPYAARLRAQLTDETRAAILWVKDVWHRLPVYPDEVGGYDVYEAVLRHGVRTPDGFDAWLRERGLPGR